MVFPFECEPFSKTYSNSKHYIFDKFNQVIIDIDIEDCASSSVLDSNGNTIIPFKPNVTIDRWAKGYEFTISYSECNYDFTVYADNKGVLIEPDLILHNGGYIGNGLFLGKFGAGDKSGLYSLEKQDYLIEPQYDSMWRLENIINVANNDELFCVSNDKHFGIVDYQNNILIPLEYDEDIYKMDSYLLVLRNGKYGLITLKNEVAYDIRYDKILYCYDNCIWCCENNTWKIVYLDGKEEILPYDDCQFPCKNTYLIVNSFKHTRYICVKKNNKWGVVDYKKQEILPIKFDEIFQYKDCNLIDVTLNGKSGLYNFKGQEIIPCKYSLLFDDGENKYITADDYEKDITHYYDTKGNLLFRHKYNTRSCNVSDGVIAVHNGEYYKFITLNNRDLF